MSRTFALVVFAVTPCCLVVPAAAGTYTSTTIDVPGAIVTFADGINDAGQIVGTFSVGTLSNITGTHGFLATPVPTPSQSRPSLLLGSGVPGLALLTRRRIC